MVGGMKNVISVLKELNSMEFPEIENMYESQWICYNCFMWSPHDSRDGKLYLTIGIERNNIHKIDIKSNELFIRYIYNVQTEGIPMIHSEEEYFQYSLLNDLTNIPLEFFLECSKLYNKISTALLEQL